MRYLYKNRLTFKTGDQNGKKIFFSPFVFDFLGLILGVSSKYGDIAYANSFFSYFGLFSSGILMWLVLCSVILFLSETKKGAKLLILCLMVPMLISYYLFSYLMVNYFSIKVFIFWTVMLLLSLLVTHFVWDIRFTPKFRMLFIIGAVLSVIYDAFIVNSFEFLVMIPEVAVSVIMLYYINKWIKKPAC